MEYIQELTSLGLKDKAAAVYLASLEIGPSPVQPIAKKAKVVRATTYVVLEELMQMGLVTKYKEGKKVWSELLYGLIISNMLREKNGNLFLMVG